jgi:heptosyltransferase-3
MESFGVFERLEKKFDRILIVRTDRIGDVILTLPMARVLKEHFPHARIAMLIQRYTAELVEDDPSVDQILFSDDVDGRALSFFHLVQLLRTERFDVVFHTHPRLDLALVTWFAGIPNRVGTGYRYYSILFNRKVFEHRKDARYHELEYNLHLLDAVGCPRAKESIHPELNVRGDAKDAVKALLRARGINEDEQIVVLHPGSGGSARDWSARNFGLLGSRLLEIPNVRIVVTGSQLEQPLINEVQSVAGPTTVTLVDALNLRQYAALANMASVFIANSTGPIHIAAAVGTPVIGLYPHITPQSADRWGPYTDRKTIFSPVDKPMDCRKCLNGRTGTCECMDSISVDKVFEAAKKYLFGNSRMTESKMTKAGKVAQ